MTQNILIRESIFHNGSDNSVINSVLEFQYHLVRYGYYAENELAVELAEIRACTYYDGQVLNGGHEQFISNLGWQLTELNRIDCVLERIGAATHATIFREFKSELEKDTSLREASIRRSGFDDLSSDPPSVFIKSIDQRFFQQSRARGLTVYLAAWIRSLPNLRVIADSEWINILGEISLSNPERQKRIEASRSAERNYMSDRLAESEERDRAVEEALRLCQHARLALVELKSSGWATTDGVDILQSVLDARDYPLFVDDNGVFLDEDGVLMGIIETDVGTRYTFSSSKAAVLVSNSPKTVCAKYVKS